MFAMLLQGADEPYQLSLLSELHMEKRSDQTVQVIISALMEEHAWWKVWAERCPPWTGRKLLVLPT